ncbi:MAG: hypothetical protein ACLPV8_18160 [Steroidobacteraceae bacterium]
MRLFRLSEVEIRPNDRVFRHPRMRALLMWLAVFCADAAMFFYALTGKWKPGYIFGAFTLLFLLWTLRFVTARFHPSNWLVRAGESGLFAQYRSYLNYQLPLDEPSVVFIPYGEIASARLVRERMQTPDPVHSGATQTQFLRYIELELSGDTTPLANALQVERSAKAPVQKRWYGTSSTLYHDYPLAMTMAPFLRIRWDVAPRASKFLDYLRSYARIADPVSLRQDFTRLQSLGNEEQQKQLRDLTARGEVITAMYIAQKLYGCSLVQAKTMVDGLTDRERPT